MSNVIKLKKGLDIRIAGEAEKRVVSIEKPTTYSISPLEFGNLVPKLLVKVDDVVEAGSPLFFDKYAPEVMFTSPVSGRVSAINRGEKRKILSIEVEADQTQVYKEFSVDLAAMSRQEIVNTLLNSGLWPSIIQRPYGIIAKSTDTPKSIFISGFDSAPLAADMNFVLKDEVANIQKGIEVLGKLTEGKVHLGLKAGEEALLSGISGVEKHVFNGPHPAGNVGIQIHHIDPINKGEVVWTADIQNVAIIGRLFNSGHVDMHKTIAVAGTKVNAPCYVNVLVGTKFSAILGTEEQNAQGLGKLNKGEEASRIINGNVLTGTIANLESSVGLYTKQISVIPEGDKYEMFGWIMPRFNKFSVSHSYFSWILNKLCPKKRYDIDTNLNGGKRAMIVTGLYEDYLPMDIYPMYLIKAALAEDIEKMENLGIYEVLPEDMALCEFVDPSKTDIQAIIQNGINLMIKELN